MKKILSLLIFVNTGFYVNSQTCKEYMEFVKSNSYGTTYYSYNSEANSTVTFYDVLIEHQYYYYAIVCFNREYFGCSEYIYQVGSNTKMYYSMNYLNSAGDAFGDYKALQ